MLDCSPLLLFAVRASQGLLQALQERCIGSWQGEKDLQSYTARTQFSVADKNMVAVRRDCKWCTPVQWQFYLSWTGESGLKNEHVSCETQHFRGLAGNAVGYGLNAACQNLPRRRFVQRLPACNCHHPPAEPHHSF